MSAELETKVSCPRCGGEGQTMEIPNGMTPMMLDCWFCRATGYVTKEEEQDYIEAASNFRLG